MGIEAQARLRSPGLFKRVFATGRRSADRCFTVLACANGGVRARLGLAVAKKNVPRAVDRNRIKRVVRESFRRDAVTGAGIDIVVIARRGTVTAANAELFRSLARHWQRIHDPVDRGNAS